MLETLPGLLEANPALVRRGRFLSVSFLVEVGDQAWLVHVAEGRVRVERGPFVMPSWRFALRAAAEEWERFWRPVPPPGSNDLFAMIRRGVLRAEGDLQPFMANLLYVKQLLELPRTAGGAS